MLPWAFVSRACIALLALTGMVCEAKAPGAEDRRVRVRLFDRNYGDFGGEFGIRSLTGCTYDIMRWVPGMVAESLSVDPVRGKKVPRRGPVDCCSANLERWFDPSEARVSACSELPFAARDTLGRRSWRFDSDAFFPMDSIGLEPAWNRDGVSLAHDFAFCMEINAGFVQRGGETLRFRGDDDLWVYLDGRLVADRGGLHYALDGVTLRLDTLPGYQGKHGGYRDLDVYFCSRIPNSSVFGMEAPLDPRPLPLAALRIADTSGRALEGADVIAGKTRLCAGAEWRLPDPADCGNHASPVRFVPAEWELEGADLQLGGAVQGQPAARECVDLDPTGLPHGTKVRLTARWGGKASRITLTVARLAKVLDGVLKGNGRAERVEIPVDAGSGLVPDGLLVEFELGGRQRKVRAFAAGAGGTLAGKLDSGEKGPEGLSSFAPVPASTTQTHFGKTFVREIRLRDGVGPILTGARVRWADRGGQQAAPAPYLEWEASEDLSGPSLHPADLLGRRAGLTRPGLAAFGLSGPAASAAAQGDGAYRFRLALSEREAAAFVSGDSLSLAPAALDALGNAAGASFVRVDPPPRSPGLAGEVRMAENPTRSPAFLPDPSLPALILVTPEGRPLRDTEAYRKAAEARGPVLVLPARGPIGRVDIAFFDHFGAPVNSGRLEISGDEWGALASSAADDTVRLGIQWYPVSAAGARIGTGAYVARGRVRSLGGALIRRADGEWIRVEAQETRFGPFLFGYIRE
jgi:fibro-slime domain-containing protein